MGKKLTTREKVELKQMINSLKTKKVPKKEIIEILKIDEFVYREITGEYF